MRAIRLANPKRITISDSGIPIVPIGVDGQKLGGKTAKYLGGLATHVFDAAYMHETWDQAAWGAGHDAEDPSAGPTPSKSWNEVQSTTKTTTREALDAIEPAEALSYVTTPTGAPLTLSDVQAKLASAQGGLGNFKSHPYETMAAAGVREALLAEIVKSVKEGLRGAPLSTLRTQSSRPLRSVSAWGPGDAAAAQNPKLLKTSSRDAELARRQVAGEPEATDHWAGSGPSPPGVPMGPSMSAVPPAFRVTATSVTGQSLSAMVQADDTVQSLTIKLCERQGTDWEQLRLAFKHRIQAGAGSATLDDEDQTLAQVGITAATELAFAPRTQEDIVARRAARAARIELA